MGAAIGIDAASPTDSAASGPAPPIAKLLALQNMPGTVWLAHQADWIAASNKGLRPVRPHNPTRLLSNGP